MTKAGPGKLGLVAGGGPLPIALAERCRAAGRPLFVLRLRGFAGPGLDGFDGAEAGPAELGKVFDLLRRAECTSVCFAGVVARPDFSALKPDLRGLKSLPGALAAARRGDDALMRFLLGEFEKEGFAIEGAQDVDADLTLEEGVLGVVAPGRWRGVVAKAPKPIQERRIDLPVIGPDTVERAAAAGLAGIAGEARGVLVVERERLIETADRLGLFVIGVALEEGG
jgi:DUF1009 family protein